VLPIYNKYEEITKMSFGILNQKIGLGEEEGHLEAIQVTSLNNSIK
jgi:hypothetical protein